MSKKSRKRKCQLSRGNDLERQLRKAIENLHNQPGPNVHILPKIQGVTKDLTFTPNMESVLEKIGEILKDNLYRKGRVILTLRDNQLEILQDGFQLRPGVENVLANIFTCEIHNQSKPSYFPPSRKLAALSLCSAPLVNALPEIEIISHSMVYDKHYVLRGPGYHSESKIYVLGSEETEPELFQPVDCSRPVLERLPLLLRELLSDFCFRSDADMVNCIAMMLTPLLFPHFLETCKPAFLIDGNQPGLGKTLLVTVVGLVCDGVVPRLMSLSADDEEVRKQTLARLQQEHGSFLVYDNVKRSSGMPINSPFLEYLTTTTEISLRILGKSEDYVCRNDRIIVITMNNTTASRDLVSRSVPIRMSYDGPPRDRCFQHMDLLGFALTHRYGILGELCGMVEYWKQCSMPVGTGCHHRFHQWACMIGGIMQSCGFPEFLANLDEADVEFDETRSGLEDLLEVVRQASGVSLPESGTVFHIPETAVAASEWWGYLTQCDTFQKELGQKSSPRSQGRAVSKIMGRLLNQPFPFYVDEKRLMATLVKIPMRSNAQGYYFEVNS